MNPIYECHGHIFMDGTEYSAAKERHSAGPVETSIRKNLQQLLDSGVTYFRDGGDNLGVSMCARTLAGEYGIEYVTPIFAIHRRGRYGGIVGKAYDTLSDFVALAEEARAMGCDFIKIMFSGIMRFDHDKPFSCPPLEEGEIVSLVSAAHDMGLRVMAHVNGADAVFAAARAGTDSIEHGYYADDACLEAMAAADCIWVPTLSAVDAFIGRDGFDRDTVEDILAQQLKQIHKASVMGVLVASGSDSGAVGVSHGGGIRRELELLKGAGIPSVDIRRANETLRQRFRRID